MVTLLSYQSLLIVCSHSCQAFNLLTLAPRELFQLVQSVYQDVHFLLHDHESLLRQSQIIVCLFNPLISFTLCTFQ